jgi:hypothetical protein
MPEDKPPEPKPETKPGEKPSEAKASGNWRGKGYVDYNTLSPEAAAIMLKRIRARMKRIESDIDVIMSILKYGPQGVSQGNQEQRQYQGKYQGGYRRYGYGKGYKRNYGRRQKRESEDDVNYE